jgi:NADH:ubiquinone oxidoreductase subunit 6 (subunit J)
MDLQPLLFWALAVLTGVSAFGVVVTQNIVRAAAWLLFALGGTAGVFFLLGADFVGATQLLVYVGGTLVLVVFGVMLTAQGPFITMKTGAAEWAVAAVVGLLLYGVIAFTVIHSNVATDLTKAEAQAQQQAEPANPVPDSGASRYPEALGATLLGVTQATPQRKLTGLPEEVPPPPRTRMGYLLPFEIVSVHLLVVLIGAAYLARAKRRRGAAP